MTTGHDISSDDARRRTHLRDAERIAVIGMKPEGEAGAIPAYLQREGYDVVPVNPSCDEVLSVECVDRVDHVDGEVDIVDIFRRSETLPEHVDEILEMSSPPELVWCQLGIRHEDAARRLQEVDIDVVQDTCIKVAHRRLLG